MNEAQPDRAAYRKRGLSTVWIMPILALIVVGWTAWTAWRDKGPVIHISFEKTDGVEVNRTQIRHKGVVLGTVSAVAPDKDFQRVDVTAKMVATAAPYLNAATKFWIVHPRVSVGSISDLNTLVSGVYIELAPGSGDATRDFSGLEEPLAVDQEEPGKNFILQAAQLGSLERESPLYFHGLQVGEVTSFNLSPDKKIMIHIFIHAPYDQMVLDQSRFWNVSGIGIVAGAEGIKIAAQSLQAVVKGGIAFDLPDGVKDATPAVADAVFPLYSDRDSANDSIYTKKISYLLRFPGSVQGLDTGAAVDLLGNRIGYVAGSSIEVDADTGQAISEVVIDIQPQRLRLRGGAGDVEQRARTAFDRMVKRKLRAQIASGNLLTGQKNINLTYIDDAAPAEITASLPYPELPTVAADDMNAVIGDARQALKDSDALIRSIGPQIQPLLASFKTTADQINTDQGSGGLSGTLDEIKQAARSVRALADYLDAHPESILRGKEKDNP